MGGGAAHVDFAMVNYKASFNAVTSPSSSSSPQASTLNFPISTSSSNNSPLSQTCCAASETRTRTGSVLGKQQDLFSIAPSKIEVETAIVAIHQFLKRISSCGSQSNRLLQVLDRTVEDVFRLLQTDPIIKRLVISLASDKYVWDAVMNNQMMQQIRKSIVFPAESCKIQNCDKQDVVSYMLNLIMDITKAKVNDLIQKFQSLMDEIFQPMEKRLAEENGDDSDDRIRSSLLLSIVILLIVVVSRFRGGA